MGLKGYIRKAAVLFLALASLSFLLPAIEENADAQSTTFLSNKQTKFSRGRSRFGRPSAAPSGVCPSGMTQTSAGCIGVRFAPLPLGVCPSGMTQTSVGCL